MTVGFNGVGVGLLVATARGAVSSQQRAGEVGHVRVAGRLRIAYVVEAEGS